MTEKTAAKYFYGLGRRKEATARVRLYAGQAGSKVNDKSLDEYFGDVNLVNVVYAPLKLIGVIEKYYISAKVDGGGKSSQAEAIRLGISRALLVLDEDNKTTLRKAGYLTRDPREKERKKPGLKRARKAPQFSKR
jgi:small subunit ribosomal protein S9